LAQIQPNPVSIEDCQLHIKLWQDLNNVEYALKRVWPDYTKTLTQYLDLEDHEQLLSVFNSIYENQVDRVLTREYYNPANANAVTQLENFQSLTNTTLPINTDSKTTTTTTTTSTTTTASSSSLPQEEKRLSELVQYPPEFLAWAHAYEKRCHEVFLCSMEHDSQPLIWQPLDILKRKQLIHEVQQQINDQMNETLSPFEATSQQLHDLTKKTAGVEEMEDNTDE
jgi:hypothetical protein